MSSVENEHPDELKEWRNSAAELKKEIALLKEAIRKKEAKAKEQTTPQVEVHLEAADLFIEAKDKSKQNNTIEALDVIDGTPKDHLIVKL